jgi:RNA polymerase sigma-70 factor (ECF subfamily)
MDALDLVIAAPAEIVDNRVCLGNPGFPGAAAIMSQADEKKPVWGTSDTALLASLIERGRRGDLEAMEALYEMFKRPVFGLAYRHTANKAVSEDLLQDVFLKVFTHLNDVRDAGTFPAWVFRISLNTCYSYLRQKKVQSERDVSLTDLEATIVDEGGEAVERDLRKPLDEAIAGLPPRLKSVFILHDVQGYKHEEIARLLGCSVGTSKSQLFKARMKLRAYLRARKVA